jgi:hypothetical protein
MTMAAHTRAIMSMIRSKATASTPGPTEGDTRENGSTTSSVEVESLRGQTGTNTRVNSQRTSGTEEGSFTMRVVTSTRVNSGTTAGMEQGSLSGSTVMCSMVTGVKTEDKDWALSHFRTGNGTSVNTPTIKGTEEGHLPRLRGISMRETSVTAITMVRACSKVLMAGP